MTACPACGAAADLPFYTVDGVPVHLVKLVHSHEEALSCPKGDIKLCFCVCCGFIWNGASNPELMSYSEDYESTQAVSPTFNAFHERLALDLIERFDLRDKTIVEIGCGQGEFITMLAGLGDNLCLGFDQVIRNPGVRRVGREGGIGLYPMLYDERWRSVKPDFVCCKMTMEHVPDVADWLRSLRRTIGDRPKCAVFFMVPEVTRILQQRAFWDIYYEHCSYWSAGSLARAFRAAGFYPIQIWTEYDDQYLLITARPGPSTILLHNEETPEELDALVRSSSQEIEGSQAYWRGVLDGAHSGGHRVVLWGGGSKAGAFLTTLGVGVKDGLEYVVDINPRRHGTFIAGTGQQIVAPEFLVEYRPETVIVMSPIYLPEIRVQLAALGVKARLVSVEEST